MRCRFRLRNRFSIRKVTLCSVTRYRATPQSVVVPQAELPDTCLAAARGSSSFASGTAVLGLPRRPIHCRAPASQPSRGRLIIVFYFITSTPTYFLSTSGTLTEPSAFWFCSTSAGRILDVASPEPLRVCISSILPSARLTRI